MKKLLILLVVASMFGGCRSIIVITPSDILGGVLIGILFFILSFWLVYDWIGSVFKQRKKK